MKIRAIDADGDWTFGKGQQSYRTGNLCIAQDIQTALLVFLGECFWATDFGVDWLNLLGASNAEQTRTAIILQCRGIILGIDGVAKITTVMSDINRASRRLSASYAVDTIFSTRISGTVQPL